MHHDYYPIILRQHHLSLIYSDLLPVTHLKHPILLFKNGVYDRILICCCVSPRYYCTSDVDQNQTVQFITDPLRHLTFLSPYTIGDGTPSTRNIYQTILPIVILAHTVCTPLSETTGTYQYQQRNMYDTDHLLLARTIQIKFAPDKSLRHSIILGPNTFEDGTSDPRNHLSDRFTNSEKECRLTRRSNLKTPLY